MKLQVLLSTLNTEIESTPVDDSDIKVSLALHASVYINTPTHLHELNISCRKGLDFAKRSKSYPSVLIKL